MTTISIVAAAALLLRLVAGVAVVAEPQVQRRTGLLRVSKAKLPAAFSSPAAGKRQELRLHGFCKSTSCTKEPCEPVCTEKPCCCWSTFAADTHPMYPAKGETAHKQQCLYPPKGFVYAPDPGLTYNDGYLDELKRQGLPVYEGRRLCCLRRSEGVQEESQRDLAQAVPKITTTAAPVKPVGVPEPGQVDPVFTTEILTTSLMNPGDEYENAQMEEAARAHLAAANDLSAAVSSLNASATAVQDVNDKLQTDPNLVRSRKHVAQMKGAIRAWAERRWGNLKKLATGDASAFDGGPAPPAGLT